MQIKRARPMEPKGAEMTDCNWCMYKNVSGDEAPCKNCSRLKNFEDHWAPSDEAFDCKYGEIYNDMKVGGTDD